MTALDRIVEMLPLTRPDWLALLFLVAVWISYQWHADCRGRSKYWLGNDKQRGVGI